MRRTLCSACESPDLELFLDLGESPIADAYTATADEVSPRYPLRVAVCGKCRLVQLLDSPDRALFGDGYSFYSSASAPLSAYHAAYAAEVMARYPELVARGVVEVGCNDGDLLRHFRDVPHCGIDPSTGPGEAARRHHLNVLIEPFSLALAQELVDNGRRPGVVFANHVLAHVDDASGCLAGIAHLMADDSVALVEVQYLPDLLVNNAFDLVYHEHRNFFSLSSLEQAAARHGLSVVDAQLTDRQGGSLRATLSKVASHGYPGDRRAERIRFGESWLDDFSAYAGMQGRAERIRARLLDLLAGQKGVTVVYGAPAKATTLLNFCGLTAEQLPWCVDTTPAKWGRHIPGTGIPIYAEDPTHTEGSRTFLLTAHNYARQVMARNPGHRWIVPIPAPVIL